MRRRRGREAGTNAGQRSRRDGGLLALGPPINLLLGAALRRVDREAPGVFDRLGSYRASAFLIAPAGLPVAFRLEPDPQHGRVTLVRPDDARQVAAAIRGPLPDLLALFDGSHDADAAFFSRRVSIEGDTGAVVALHNTLEAADLGLADLIGAPRPARARLNAGLAALVRAARSVGEA